MNSLASLHVYPRAWACCEANERSLTPTLPNIELSPRTHPAQQVRQDAVLPDDAGGASYVDLGELKLGDKILFGLHGNDRNQVNPPLTHMPHKWGV